MNPLLRQTLSRRTVLRGLGVSLTLPLLEAMMPRLHAASAFKPLAKSAVKPAPRVIFCYIPNGVNIREWLPEGTGKGYALSPSLEKLSAHQNDFSVLSGLGHPNSTGGHAGADTWLTGANLTRIPGQQYANSVSVDQRIAEVVGASTRFPSLQLSNGSGTGPARHTNTLSFDRNGTPIPAENNPQRIFDRLFVPEDAGSREATLRRFAQKRSILDEVLSEAKALENKLGQSDRAKLGEYLDSVRETELRVGRAEEWIDIPKPAVDSSNLALASKGGDRNERPEWLDVMLELSYLSFVTDTTRVITFQWSREANGFGGKGENHHDLSHHGGDAGMLKQLAGVDHFHLERLNRFLSFLKTTEEGGGSLLDNTMVVFGSGMNNGLRGDHSPKNLPLLVAGGSALGLTHGQHLAHDENDHPPLSNMLLTVMQKMGVESDEFQDSTGTLTGLA